MEFGINEKIAAQDEYCKKSNNPKFSPNNGLCYHCKKQIYNLIKLEKAQNEHIIHCPHCNKSYCE